MHDTDTDKNHEHHPHHHHRNFWHEWRDEMHRHEHGEPHEPGQIPTPDERETWRRFFHKSMGDWPEEHWIFRGRRFSPWHQGMDSFNPFVASLLSKGGGLLPLFVLHFVAQQPRYGNEIMDLLAGRTGGQWVSNPGAVYPLLGLLEHQGLISGRWEDPQKRTVRIYTITPAGQEELARLKTIVSPKVEETIQVLQGLLRDLDGDAETSQPPEDSQVN